MKEVLGDPKSWNRPKKTMIIYEYEQSPLCKKVRMACSALDLIVEYRPCPGGTYGFSDQLKQRTLGSDTVPFLYDPGNSVQTLANIYDAGEIIEYLFENFGPGVNKIPGNLKAKGTTKSTSGVKPAKNYDESNMFKKALTLYGFEGGDIQKVRETLSSLCLAHVMVNVAKGSANRATLDKKGVKTPFLQDPNTRKEFEGAKECIAYLTATYTK
tara:strand:- start:107 stop:745 length:639 start_codon:yes stop_codon:yes gene_type:complete